MKKLIFSLLLITAIAAVKAQAPQSFKYQTVVRNASGNPITNQKVNFRTSILQTSATGDSVYVETQLDTTNNFGLANLEIGTGIVVYGDFISINWGSNAYFIKTEIDITGGSTFAYMGTSQLLSVPYALYAEKSGTVETLNAWGLTGNTGTTAGTNFIGTSDNKSIVFKTNNNEIMRMTTGLYPDITIANGVRIHNTGGTVNEVLGFNQGNVGVSLANINNGFYGNVGIMGVSIAPYSGGFGAGGSFWCGSTSHRPPNGLYGVVTTATSTNGGTAIYANSNGAGGTNIGGFFSASGGAKSYALLTDKGKVGIGTLTPKYALHVYNDSNQIGLLVQGTDDWYSSIYVEATKSSAQPTFGYVRQDVLLATHSIATNGDWYLNINGSEKIRVSATGNLGVGYTVPTSRIHVAGNGYSQLRLATSYTPSSSADSNGNTGDI
ncbi:MAG: hypothetical protein PHD97_06335, partial [Bacteroidales bacterium]|nr:hypothetical protein [Bacteroidales bacterium]